MDSQSQNDTVGIGLEPQYANTSEFNAQCFLIQQMLGKIQTMTLIKIVACTNDGGLSPVGFVDVVPLVNQVDLQGIPTEHVTIYNVPYMRIQGGSNAIILDPQVGDLGICGFASRDISKIKSTKQQGNPNSFRRFSYSDGLYLGGTLNGPPSQYVQFSSAGISITSPSAVTLTAPVVTINAGTSCTVNTPTFTVNGATVLHGTLSQTGGGAATMSGSLTVTGDVTASGTSLHTHTHGGVQTGGGNTGGPT